MALPATHVYEIEGNALTLTLSRREREPAFDATHVYENEGNALTLTLSLRERELAFDGLFS